MVETKKRTVIVGGGIVGASAAFFITRHPKFDPASHEIVLIEAVTPGCAASGKAGGLLSKTAFPHSLGPLSFKLHAQLAKEFGGDERWGYRPMSTVSVEGTSGRSAAADVEDVAKNGNGKGGCKSGSGNITSTSNGANSDSGDTNLPKALDWLRASSVDFVEVLGGTDEFAQVHPYFFTNFLIDHIKSQGLIKLITAKVTKILGDKDGKCTGVEYSDEESTQTLMADTVLVAAGPWTSRLLPACPVVGMKVPSITVRPTEPVSAYALFTELDLADTGRVSPEIYARRDEIYICGESIDDPLPETADLITVDPKYGDALFFYGSALSDKIAGGEIKRMQACYLPVVDSQFTSGPFIGKTNVPNLLVAAGHTCWGINNGPATGLLLAEVLFEGRAHTSNIRGLTPSSYFDSSSALHIVA